MHILKLNIQGVGEYEFVLPSTVTTDSLYYQDGTLVNQGSALTLTPFGSELSVRIPAASEGVVEVRQQSGMSQTWVSHNAFPVSGWEYIRPGDTAMYRVSVIMIFLLILLLLRGAFRGR